MLEPLSMTLCLGYAALAPYARTSSAVSSEAGQVHQAVSEVLRDHEGSQSLFGRTGLALSCLNAAVSEVSPDDDQSAVNPQALWNAEQFLRALPADVSVPEFSVDPDGAIAFDWLQSRNRMVSVSISHSERIAYAWLDGSDKGHGVARFRDSGIPTILLSLIRTIVNSNEHASLRAA
jgi:hypothetical protein